MLNYTTTCTCSKLNTNKQLVGYVLASYFSSALVTWGYSNQVMAEEEEFFPQSIVYQLEKNGVPVGTTSFEYSIKTDKQGQKLVRLKLGNFSKMGVNSDETLVTYLATEPLSLYMYTVKKAGENQYSVQDTGKDEFGRRTFKYMKFGKDSNIVTTLLSDYPVIDIPGMLFFVTEKAKRKDQNTEHLNLFVDKTTSVLTLIVDPNPPQSIAVEGKKIKKVTRLTLKNNADKDVLTYDIISNHNRWYPAIITMQDSQAGVIKMQATTVVP